ncbi:hypothetical protein ACIGXM_23040 [Kitasatospora sp. NPDC052896]|uniref:hypothetical protein n=1 Tax=Kitasatospora sp. NPDC052896 TaxID=3364061 RepID=UPI0037C84073
MTDTPGWVPPSSSGSDPEGAPAAAPAPDGPSDSTIPGPAAPPPLPHEATYGAPYATTPVPPTAPSGRGPQTGWGPQPVWGPQPGWGQPTWGAPPSPKPGIIPLRPLGVGEILDGAISTVRRHWRTVLGISLVVAVLEQTVQTLLQWWEPTGPANALTTVSGALFGVVAVLVLTALLTMVVSKAVLGEPVSLAIAWRAARPQLTRLLGLTVLLGLIIGGIVLGGFVPLIVLLAVKSPTALSLGVGLPCALAGLLAGLWTAVRLSLATPALMLEKQGVRAALGRSRRLVRGSWWRILGISLLGLVITEVLAGIIGLPFTIAAAVLNSSAFTAFGADPGQGLPLGFLVIIGIGAVIGGTVTFPIQAAVNVLLYVDQRIRREALDLELARAAGLPEYGGTGWAGQPAPPAGI